MRRLASAERLLQSFGITEPNEIDLEAIAWELGIEITEEKLDGCEAQIIGHGDRAEILINKNTHPDRKRFSIGHEMGHWEHHRGKCLVCRAEDIGNNDKKYTVSNPEFVADQYSSDLLMPAYLFEPIANKAIKASFEVILDIKENFNTSIIATALRFVDFSPMPSMLVCHDKYGRKWFKRGKNVPVTLFPRNDLDTDSIAIDVLYGKTTQVRPQRMGGDAWFDKHGADRYELLEHSITSYNGRILTLLSWEDEEMLERYDAA